MSLPLRARQSMSAAANRLSNLASQIRSASTMKEAFISKGPVVTIEDVPIPKPGPRQVLTKVIFSGSNPKDWKRPENLTKPTNQGDDISGIVEAVGDEVYEFKKGDRVAAFHEMRSPHGSYAEYAISWDYSTFHLPQRTTFEEGAAIPLACMTAAVGLFGKLKLPSPFVPAQEPIPLVVYGGSSAVGSYVIQLAQRANIHPIIAVAGRAQDHVEKLIDRSKGDAIVDYRKGDEAVSEGIREALKGAKLQYAYDAVSQQSSWTNIGRVLDPESGRITFVLPVLEEAQFGPGVEKSVTWVGAVHGRPEDFYELGFVYFRYFAKGLREGWLKAQPTEVIPGGLEGVETGLKNLKEGKASAVKYIFKIADTPGAGA